MSKESVRKAVEEFIVRPSDIIVSTFPKTGTTLITWLCHQLRTGGYGHADFDTLYEVIPWPLLSWDIGYDPNVAGSQYFPRIFKSHLRMASVYRGCRYVVMVRDPVKTALSFHAFMRDKGVPGVSDMDLGTFVTQTPFIRGRVGRASLWEYYREYHILRNCSSVLILVYEDAVSNLLDAVRMLANFIGVIDAKKSVTKDDEGLIERVARLCTKEAMVQYSEKFDEPYERAGELGRVGDLTQLSPATKISTRSRDGEREMVNDVAKQFLDNEWRRVMAPLGYDDYASFVAMIRAKNAERFSQSTALS